MLIGQDRAGKTSLKKSLLGLSFDPEEPSTVGVDVNPSSFCVDVDNVRTDWQILKDNPKNDFDDSIASIMAEKLNESREAPEPDSALGPMAMPQEVWNMHAWFLRSLLSVIICTSHFAKISIYR
jgi:hypothetical protein